MMDAYLVQHKNGKTKVFIVDGLKAYLCRDGRVVHTEQLSKTGIARSWAQYLLLPEDSEASIQARQSVLNGRSKKEVVRERSQQIVKTMQDRAASPANAEKLRQAQLRVGDFLRVPHLRSHVLAKVIRISRIVYISKFFRKRNIWMPEKKLEGAWTKVSVQQANQFMEGTKWQDVCK